MEDALDHIKKLAAASDGASRRHIMDALHEVAYSLEDAHDTINRMGYLHLQTAAVKIGFDLELFKQLSAADGSLTVDNIAQKAEADPVFLGKKDLRVLEAMINDQ